MADLDNIKIIKEKRKSLVVEVYPNFSVVIKSPEQAKDNIMDFYQMKNQTHEENYLTNKRDYRILNKTIYLEK